MKRIYTLIILLGSVLQLSAQGKTVTLADCYKLARNNYPLLKQYDLIQKTKDFTLKNAWRGYIPQINANGQATYQSEVVNFADVFGSLPPQFAGLIKFPSYSKDQYRITGEVSQTIFDGQATKYKKENAAVAADISQQSLEVNLYALKDRVNQVYFGVLLIDEELLQNSIQQQDIQNGIDKTTALVNNGTAYRSSVDELKAQLMQIQQSRVELISSRRSYLMVLGLLTNQSLDESSTLATPETPRLVSEIKRPELQLYDIQKKNYIVQSKQLETGLMPVISAYFDGSYGRPTLNSVSNDFGPYWIAGIKFNWTLTALYTMKNSRAIFDLSQADLDVQKETFLYNTRIAMAQESEDVRKYNDLVANDQQIVDLRVSVKNASDAQLKNGVITGHDYLTEVDAEAQARLNLILHQVQLLQAQYNHLNTTGN
jgi:outer membrane protein TolC